MWIGDMWQRWAACLSMSGADSCTLAARGAWPLAALGLVLVARVIWGGRRLLVTLRTLPAQAWTPALARRLAHWVKTRSYSDAAFFGADGAGEPWIERRRQGMARLAEFFRAEYGRSRAWGDAIRDSFSDLRFTDTNRVPFPFVRFMREHFNLCSVVTESDGPRLLDLDGHWTLDVSGSYGLNVAGFGRYKDWMAKGLERVRDLGPVLGPLHPLVAENVAMLRSVSKLEEVSFHMSGTEAVMAAVRLARFNTRRRLIVCFAGAYHGWWDGVQPGLGSERPLDDCLTLKDLHPSSLAVIRRRAREIAGVLVNPVQSFHPNTPPPNDAVLLMSSARKTAEGSRRYAQWLTQLRAVCDEADIPLIFDEVYTGFRLAPGGAQEYFGVSADMVVYGKTVAGGMPIGVVCGRKALMNRFDPERPLRVAYVIGTFSAHPVVMGAMNEFLRWVMEPCTPSRYDEMNERCAQWVQATNRRLVDAQLPVRVVHLATIWTVLFTEPGRYNWLLQYYLRAEGVTLSWVGTGRCLASMDFTDKDYDSLQAALVGAAHKMTADGWWLSAEEHPRRERAMRVRLLRDVLGSVVRVPRPLQSFYAEVMRRKKDDHHASHSNVVNQLFHIVSSSVFIGCYVLAFWDLTTAMWAGSAALLLRQFGHAILEPPCHDKEAVLLGYNTRNKTLILGTYLLIPVVFLLSTDAWTVDTLTARAPAVAWAWFWWTAVVVGGRVVYLVGTHGVRLALVWFIKLLTDPVTDIIAYSPRYLRHV
jgi:glutamate-1-semialdehyde 2,1-aminomutase